MSENEMSQQERDAAVIAEYRERAFRFVNPNITVNIKDWQENRAQMDAIVYDAADAALRSIDLLRAENERLRADNEALRTACDHAVAMIDDEYNTLWKEFAYDACRALSRIRAIISGRNETEGK